MLLTESVSAGGARRLGSPDSSPAAAAPPSSSTPLRALLSFRLSDLLFLALGCFALLASLGQQGEWRLERLATIAHSHAPSPASSAAPLLLPPLAVVDIDGDSRNGQ